MLDAIVVGGGPVGSYIAGKLAGAGHKVTVLDKKQAIGKTCCTGIISRECVNAFAVNRDVIRMPISGASLFSPSGCQVRLKRDEPQAYVLDRPAFDTDMARQSQQNGAEYDLGVTIDNIAVDREKVTVSLTRQDKHIDLEARAVVIATGFGSGLSEKLGLGKPGDFAAGAQAEVEITGVNEVEVYVGHDIAPGFFAWLVPTSSHTAKAGLLVRKEPGAYLKKFLSSLMAKEKIITDNVEINYGAVPLKPISKSYGERLIVAGDAAGQVKPTSGGGIYYGLLCADIAAATLHEALALGDLSARRLAAYERDWHKKLEQELKIDHWARQLFERLDDKRLDRAFEVVRSKGIDQSLPKASNISFDWHSQAIMKLVGYKALSGAIGVFTNPFKKN